LGNLQRWFGWLKGTEPAVLLQTKAVDKVIL